MVSSTLKGLYRARVFLRSIYPCLFIQVNYSDMLNRIEPLRNELKSLEHEALENQHKHEEVQRVIRELERSIAKYKEEYAVLISQAQAIKADLAAVEGKV